MTEIAISPAGMRIVKLLVGNTPQTVAELTDAMGVTRTAVTEQLGDLAAAGFVERETERLPGRGRPRHLYRATDAALASLFPGNQRLLVPAFCDAILGLGGEAMLKRVLRRVSRAMAQHYSERITTKKPHERLRQLIQLLSEEGGLVDAVEDEHGRLLIRKRTCPFISMVDSRRSVCYVDQEMLSTVVGRPVRRIDCRHEGAACCTFEIVATAD